VTVSAARANITMRPFINLTRTYVRVAFGRMSSFALVLPDDPDLLGRLATALQAQADPPISLSRSAEAVITFDSITPPMMLRCRVVQALEEAGGPDWQSLVREVRSSA